MFFDSIVFRLNTLKETSAQWPGRTIASLLLLLIGAAGCVSPKRIVYFQESAGMNSTIQNAETYIPRIKPGDVLSIQVNSLNPEATVFFNPYATMQTASVRSQPQNNTSGLPEMTGYLVSEAGNIDLPLIGRITVGELTVSESTDLIKQKLIPFLKEPTVNVRNQNFRVSVLGEVARPALFTIPNNQITLIEALSLAGDATIYGRRDNVLIVREENGRKTFARIDLTQRDFFRSPYYYLHPNDVVYVEPGKARVANADRLYQIMPSILGALSVIAIVLTRR